MPAYQYEAGLDNLPAYRIWQSPGLPDLLPDYCRLSHKVPSHRRRGRFVGQCAHIVQGAVAIIDDGFDGNSLKCVVCLWME